MSPRGWCDDRPSRSCDSVARCDANIRPTTRGPAASVGARWRSAWGSEPAPNASRDDHHHRAAGPDDGTEHRGSTRWAPQRPRPMCHRDDGARFHGHGRRAIVVTPEHTGRTMAHVGAAATGIRGTVMAMNGNALGRIRTCDTRFRKPVLYPLSYEGDMRRCTGRSIRVDDSRTAPPSPRAVSRYASGTLGALCAPPQCSAGPPVPKNGLPPAIPALCTCECRRSGGHYRHDDDPCGTWWQGWGARDPAGGGAHRPDAG